MDKLARIKTKTEIVAFAAAAVFLVVQLIGGEFNYGMELALEANRSQLDTSKDLVSISLKMKRPDHGRITIKDVEIEVIKGFGGMAEKLPSEEARIQERIGGNNLALPPGDATQLAYWFKVPKKTPALVDVSVLGKRTGLSWFLGEPQWRASIVVHPIQAVASSAQQSAPGDAPKAARP
jgi:hypothetical protein